MSKEYDDTNRGVLFRNTKKEKDSHPDYNGSINVDGTDYWLNAWIKEGKSGKFFSMSVKPKEEKKEEKRGGGVADLDSDLPFAARSARNHAE